MNRVKPSFRLCRPGAWLVLFLAGGMAFSDAFPQEETAPFSKDAYSGRTVMSFEERYDIIKSRFFNAPVRDSRAPELNLVKAADGEAVTLTELIAEKPVVLIFGSYGCDVLIDGMEAVLDCHRAFGDRVDFVLVYVREAHSLEADEAGGVAGASPVISDPATLEERIAAARLLAAEKKLPFPVLVDSLDDVAATRWAGWPVRAFVVDQNRTVVYSGKPGPWGFFPSPGYVGEGFSEMRPHPDRFNQESLFEFLAAYLKRVR